MADPVVLKPVDFNPFKVEPPKVALTDAELAADAADARTPASKDELLREMGRKDLAPGARAILEQHYKTTFGEDPSGQVNVNKGVQIAAERRRGPKPVFPLEGEKTGSVSLKPVDFDPFTGAPTGVTPGDFAKSGAAGALSGAGAIAQGGGELLARGINLVGGKLGFDPQARAANPLQGWINDLLDSRSTAAKKAEANSQISGELLKPESWNFGNDPSVAGIALQGMNAIGQFAPNLGVALVTAGASIPAQLAIGATVGGLQALGAGAQEEREAIGRMTHEQLLQGSKLYAELINRGVPPGQAKEAVAEAAALGGGLGNAIPSAAEGAFENFLIGALTRGKVRIPALGGGMAGRVATGTVGGGVLGGSEEAVEQVGQNVGSNVAIGGERPVGQDTLQQFVMGMIAEGAAGAGAGALSKAPQPAPAAVAAPADPAASAAAAPPVTGAAPAQAPQEPAGGAGVPLSPIDQARSDAQVLKSGGDLAGADETRTKNATLVAVYGENAAVRHVIDAPGQFSAIGDAMLMAAPTVERVRATIQQGQESRDITPDILGAIDELARIKASGQSVAQVMAGGVGHDVSFEGQQLIQFLDENAGNPKRIAAFLESYLQEVENATGVPSKVRGRAFDIIAEQHAARKKADEEKALEQVAEADKADAAKLKKVRHEVGMIRAETALADLKAKAVKPAGQTAMEAAFERARTLKGKSHEKPRSTSDGAVPAGKAAHPAPGPAKGAGPAARGAGAVPQHPQADHRGVARPVRAGGDRPGAGEGALNRGAQIADELTKGEGTRENPVIASRPKHINRAAARAAAQPSAAQKGADNYAKGHFKFEEKHPLSKLGVISIETPKGRERVAKDGTWSVPSLPSHYGHLAIAEGKDGDKADVFVGDDLNAKSVYVIDQIDPDTGRYDETKSMIGFSSEKAARTVYAKSFSDGKGQARIGAITEMTPAQFVARAQANNLKEAVAYKSTAVSSESQPSAAAGVNANLPANESTPYRLIADTERSADLHDAQALFSKGFANLDVPVKLRVLKSMFLAADKPEVFKAIVASIPVDVVNDLVGTQFSAKAFLHDSAVFKNTLAANYDLPVGARGIDAQVRSPTFPFAEVFGVDRALAAGNGGSAAVADEGNRHGTNVAENRAEQGPASALQSAAEAMKESAQAIKEMAQAVKDSVSQRPAKEPWQMTREEYVDSFNGQRVQKTGFQNRLGTIQNAHADAVDTAVQTGKPVPNEVLAEYPEIVRRYAGLDEPPSSPAVPAKPGEESATERKRERARKAIAEAEERARAEKAARAARDKLVEAQAEELRSLGVITDFGEKIGGARKDVWQTFNDRLKEAEDVDIASEPLSKSWPEPDYQALLDGGADPWAVSYMHAARDAIPRKPSKKWKLDGWVKIVTTLRDLTNKLANGTSSIGQDSVMSVLQKMSGARAIADIAGRIELYQLVGHSKSLAGVRISSGEYSLFEGKEYNPPKVIWSVEMDAAATAFSNWPRMMATGSTKAEALQDFKTKYATLKINEREKTDTTFDIFSKRNENGYWIGKKIGRNPTLLEGPFKTVKEARAYKDEHHDQLISKLEKVKEIPSVRRDTNEPRIGEDMRNGQDVTPQMFGETFGFRGVEFGNWVEQGKRQKDLNDAFDALMDMAAVLNVPPKALSLNGELGLAFGARGTGGVEAAKAHYESGHVVINLTKKEGAGSLGHEWWHALDNYFSRMRGKRIDYLTEGLDVSLAARGSQYQHAGEVRKEMIDAFGQVVRAIRETALKARSSKLDAKRSKDYWTTGREMAARAYESYLISKLQDQSASNDYLANIVDEKTWKAAEGLGWEIEDSYPYPTAGEVPKIRAAFDAFFQAVQSKETDKGVAMFSRADENDIGSAADTIRAQIGPILKAWPNAPAVHVIPSMAEAPQAMRLMDNAMRSTGATGVPEAFLYRNAVYLVADGLTPGRVYTALFHESLGHFGLRGTFGDKLNPILDRVAFDFRDRVAAKAAEYGLDVKDAGQRRQAAEEVLAELAQSRPELGVVKRLIAAIRQFLRDIGIDLKLSDADVIANYILPARGFVERGRAAPTGEPVPAFSRAAALASARTMFDNVTRSDRVLNRVISKFNTPFHIAETHPEFKPVYEEAQDYNQDVSRVANETADLAPDLLPRIEGFSDFKKSAPSNDDIAATANALYAGTLWGGGSPLEGRVWTDEELRTGRARDGNITIHAFDPVSEPQIKLYRQALASVGHSLTEHAKSLVWRLAKQKDIRLPQGIPLSSMVAVADDLAATQIEGKRDRMKGADDETRARAEAEVAELDAFRKALKDIQTKTEGLIQHGYFPAMRFGQYAVNVQTMGTDGKWKEEFFGRYETQTAANLAKAELLKEYPDATSRVTSGVMNDDAHKLFQGLNLDALELFSEHMRSDDGKPISADPIMQEYFRIAVTERSTLKRQIHRKGTPGFSRDVPRALAQFTVSNATSASRNYHAADMLAKVQKIKAGDLQAYATRYVRYLQDPQEESPALRGFLANYYILGSIAFGAVNMTQPILMTAPYLSQYTGWGKAMAQLGRAAKDLVTGRKDLTPDEQAAYARATKAGIVSPQEIHQIRAESRASMMGDSPLWQKLEAVLAERGMKLPGKLLMRKAAFLWGSIYSMTEQFNRGTTFLAAYRVGKEKGEDAYTFAKNAVDATQGVYARSNRPEVSRGAVGATIMTFKQFSIAYLELAKRLYDNKGPDGKPDRKAFAVLMLTLMALAGAEGLPFAEDVEDLIDTIGQWMGYPTNAKKALRKRFVEMLGPDIADILLHGASAIPGVPIDVSNRLGMHNIIPGSALLKASEPDKTRDIIDILGPAAGLFKNTGTAIEGLATGKPGDTKLLLPSALQNVMKAAEMVDTGTYRDTKGRKVMNVDAVDAFSKLIGFQPAKVARETRVVGQNQQDIALHRVIEDSIASKWAHGTVDRDPGMVAEAVRQWKDWNATNKDFPIQITGPQIARRIKELQMSREERFIKSAPKEIRGDVARDVRQ